MESSERTYYGTVRVQRAQPPSRQTATLTIVLPAELARVWPEWATHVHVHADADGLRLEPVDPKRAGMLREQGRDRVPPFAR